MTFTSVEVREKYERFARWYDLAEGPLEILLLARLRRRLLARAAGRVLEVAVGTGKNLPHYPPGCRITAVDLSPAMLERAQHRAQRLGLAAEFHLADAAALPFASGTFDTVVSTLSTCTFPDPVAALREMARVCRRGGRILLLEHGRSSRPWLARLQDRLAPGHYARTACRWNQHPPELVRQAGLRLLDHSRHLWGIFHVMVAEP